MNLTELLDRAADAWPRKPAIIEEAESVSYAALSEKVSALASQLAAHRLPPGCRVGLCYPNSVNYIALTFALWRSNAVVVPIPLECTEAEVSEMVETMQLEAMIRPATTDAGGCAAQGFVFEKLKPSKAPDNHGLNIAFIRFTSGTTSERKGVVLCHETICDRVQAANQVLRIGPEDTVMWSLPMSHHFLITILLYLSRGATIVLARHVLARPFIEAINRWRGTVLYGAPFHYALLAREDSGAKLDTVRMAISTTCALPREVAADFRNRFGIPLIQALGIIECGLVSLNTGDSKRRWNSVGRPVPGCRVQILDPDADGCGEVAISGPGMFDAYASPWLPREKVLRDGWFTTGDLGRLDEEGFLFLVGRKSAVINLAGRKVFPEEIEAVLNRHPAVRESRAYGRVHPHLGEVVEADVVLEQPDADLQSVRELCRSQLASFKLPSRIHVVEALPRTAATGKLRRAVAVASHD